jgi:magnesium-protoporphyrin O-methyltransferase
MAADKISSLMQKHAALQGWQAQRTQRVSSGFYKSQALELMRL